MSLNRFFSFVIFIIALTIMISCSDSQKKPALDKKSENQELKTKSTTVDSVIITVALKGKRDRLNILQQKVMLMAKKKLADSLIKLRNMHSDSSVADPNDYEVSMHDMHVMKEGLRYPDKSNPEIIEAYITLGIKYDKK